ncbi:MAG: GrpB family protein [Proteobacteria bacterium]|nr:MAG: GrpB family protein [Pseudomonadota bacterium]
MTFAFEAKNFLRQTLGMAITNQLNEYDPIWSVRFQSEVELLKPVFGRDLLEIHHVGSTAIPGMLAKPEIDILVVLHAGADLQSYLRQLEPHGYRSRPDANFSSGHLYFSKDVDGRRTHKLHLCLSTHPNVVEQLAFRDFLIRNPRRSELYRQLKLQLAASNTQGMSEYLEGKAPFIRETLELSKADKA